jgi:hypothetical protein
MPRISSSGIGPSNADVAKETTLLTKQGKVDGNNKPLEWAAWKAT